MKRHPDARTMVLNTLRHVVDGTDSTYELDDCFSPGFSDPKLQAIRQRLYELPDQFPPEAKGQFCGKGGIEVMRRWIEELSSENA